MWAALCKYGHSSIKNVGVAEGLKVKTLKPKKNNWKACSSYSSSTKCSFWNHWSELLSQSSADFLATPAAELDNTSLPSLSAGDVTCTCRNRSPAMWSNSWYGVNSAVISNLLYRSADSPTQPVFIGLVFLHLFIMPEECEQHDFHCIAERASKVWLPASQTSTEKYVFHLQLQSEGDGVDLCGLPGRPTGFLRIATITVVNN